MEQASVSQRIAAGVTALALSVALAGGALVASPTPASAQENAAQLCREILPELNEFASAFVGAEVTLTQGACVSAIQAGNPTAAAAALCRTPELAAFFGENHGACVQGVKGFLEEFFP